MKRFIMALVGAMLAIASLQVSAKAATYDLGDITNSSNDQLGGALKFPFQPATVISDDIKFTLSAPSFVSGDLDNLQLFFLIPLVNISGLTATFLGNPLTFDSNGNFSIAGMLAAGDYLIHIAGTTSGIFGGLYNIELTAATTPIPGALLLFVTAIGGMAGFAGLRRRGSAQA